MSLSIPLGTTCFVDANILYYSLVPMVGVTERCLAFLDRIVANEITACASVAVLADVLHKVMISEVAQITGRDRAGLVGYLGKHPEIIAQLVQYPLVMDRLAVLPLTLLQIDPVLLDHAASLAVSHRLLTGDATILALMHRHAISDLVTNDNDFDNIAGLRIWKPR